MALSGINALSTRGATALADGDMTQDGGLVYLDTNGDGLHSPLDVLLTINELPSSNSAAADAQIAPLSSSLTRSPLRLDAGTAVSVPSSTDDGPAVSLRPPLSVLHEGIHEDEEDVEAGGHRRALRKLDVAWLSDDLPFYSYRFVIALKNHRFFRFSRTHASDG